MLTGSRTTVVRTRVQAIADSCNFDRRGGKTGEAMVSELGTIWPRAGPLSGQQPTVLETDIRLRGVEER